MTRGRIGTTLLGMSLLGCSDAVEPVVEVARVEIANAPVHPLGIGDTLTLSAVALDRAGLALEDRQVRWSSTLPDVASVADGGRVQALAAGLALIEAEAGGVVASIPIAVRPRLLRADVHQVQLVSTRGGMSAPAHVRVETTAPGGLPALDLSVVHPYEEPGGWLRAEARSGGDPSIVTLRADPGTLQPGSYYATLLITPRTGESAPERVGVALQVQSGVLSWVRESQGLTSMPLNGIWGVPGGPVFAVGGEGILELEGGSWRLATAPEGAALNSIWGSSPTNVVAVGEHGLILHYDGAHWVSKPTGTPDSFTGVWGRSSSEIYAVARGGVMRYDGSAWRTMTSVKSSQFSFGAPLYGIWGSADGQLFVAGLRFIGRYDGTSWTALADGADVPWFRAVWGKSASEVYFVGDAGAIRRWDGTQLEVMESGTIRNLDAVWGTPSGDVYAAGDAGVVLRLTGGRWVGEPSDLPADLRAGWSDGSRQFIVGEAGTILRRSSKGWEVMETGPTLHAVRALTPNLAYAVGEFGYMMRYSGGQWGRIESPTRHTLYDLWGRSETELYAVGDSGTVLRYDGAEWHTLDAGTDASLLAVARLGGDSLVVAGQEVVLRFDGSAWTSFQGEPRTRYSGVWVPPGGEPFLVSTRLESTFRDTGYFRTRLLRLRSTGPEPLVTIRDEASAAQASLLDVWGTSASSLYALAFPGHLMRFDGAAWSELANARDLHGLWGSGEDDVYAVGKDGGILHFDGHLWSRSLRPTEADLHDVHGTVGASVWLVGENLTILRGRL